MLRLFSQVFLDVHRSCAPLSGSHSQRVLSVVNFSFSGSSPLHHLKLKRCPPESDVDIGLRSSGYGREGKAADRERWAGLRPWCADHRPCREKADEGSEKGSNYAYYPPLRLRPLSRVRYGPFWLQRYQFLFWMPLFRCKMLSRHR